MQAAKGETGKAAALAMKADGRRVLTPTGAQRNVDLVLSRSTPRYRQ